MLVQSLFADIECLLLLDKGLVLVVVGVKLVILTVDFIRKNRLASFLCAIFYAYLFALFFPLLFARAAVWTFISKHIHL